MTILIADQDPGFRHAVKSLLQVDEKVKMVWEADDGEMAIELAREHRPDLVLMDMSLPRVNGLEATRMIKELGVDVQVILMGEYTEPVYRLAAIRSGADAFIPKSNAWARSDVASSVYHRSRLFTSSAVNPLAKFWSSVLELARPS
jgi:two-component system response regulator EvgA